MKDLLFIGNIHPHPGGSGISNSQILLKLSNHYNIISISPITKKEMKNQKYWNSLFPKIKIIRYCISKNYTSTHESYDEIFAQEETIAIHKIYKDLDATFCPETILLGRESYARVTTFIDSSKYKIILRMAGAATIGLVNNSLEQKVRKQYINWFEKIHKFIVHNPNYKVQISKLLNKEVTLIENGVNTKLFKKVKVSENFYTLNKIPKDKVIISHISGLESIKRPLDFLYVAKSLKGFISSIHFLVIGEGPMIKDIKQFIKLNKLENLVTICGWVEYSRMPIYYNVSDIVVMPSQDDMMPRVYLETMACEKVIVASNINASNFLIKEGLDGFIFNIGDIEEICTIIRMLIKDAQLRHKIGLNARKKMLENNSWESIILKYHNLINN